MRIVAILGKVPGSFIIAPGITFILSAAMSMSAGAAPIGIQDALQLALEGSPTYDAAKRAEVVGHLETRSAGARLLPSIDFTSSQGVAGPNLAPQPLQVSQSPWTSQLTLSVTENLYDNGVTLNRFRAASLNRDYASLAMIQARDFLALNVSRQFYRYSLAMHSLKARREQKELVAKQYAQIEARYRQGLKPRNDLIRLRAQLRRAELEVYTAENSVSTAKIELARFLGRDAGVSLDFREVEASDRAPSIPSSAPAISRSFEYRLAEIRRAANELEVNLAERRYWPQVFVTAGANYGVNGYLGAGSPTSGPWSWNALVGLQYNLLDWGIRRRDVAVAEQKREIAADELQQGVLEARTGAETLLESFTRLKAEASINRELLTLSQESFDLINESFRQGKSSYLDLTNALNELIDARLRSYSTYFSILQNLAQYRYYEGTLYETLAKSTL